MIESVEKIRDQAELLMPEHLIDIENILKDPSPESRLYSLYVYFQKLQGNSPLSVERFNYASGDSRDRLEQRRPTRARFRAILEQGLKPQIAVQRKLIGKGGAGDISQIESVSEHCMLRLSALGFRSAMGYSPEEFIKFEPNSKKSPEVLFGEHQEEVFKATV